MLYNTLIDMLTQDKMFAEISDNKPYILDFIADENACTVKCLVFCIQNVTSKYIHRNIC